MRWFLRLHFVALNGKAQGKSEEQEARSPKLQLETQNSEPETRK